MIPVADRNQANKALFAYQQFMQNNPGYPDRKAYAFHVSVGFFITGIMNATYFVFST